MRIGKKAEALIVSYEGWDLPWEWPGGSSGITLPIGYDMGYDPFERDWKGLLEDQDFERLKAVVGLTGQRAKAVASTLRGIHIPRKAALQVFDKVTIPRYEDLTIKTFPNSNKMPPDAFGALVSLVFNRGSDLDDRPGRKPRGEMRDIRTVLERNDPASPNTLNTIAKLVRAQARYWTDNKQSDGDLHDRRLAEAALIAG